MDHETRMKTLVRVAPLGILILLVLFTIRPPLDLDLGWHLRYGQYFFQTGTVLRENILSIVWPDYQWVQASWGYDLLLYQIFTHFGFLGLSLSAAAITLTIFILITWPLKRFSPLQLALLAAVFLTQTAPMFAAGLRSQTPSALFFTITLLVVDRALTSGTKAVFLLPVLFWIWANTHGGFFLGLVLFSVMWGAAEIRGFMVRAASPKHSVLLGLMLVLSYLTPLINPWGARIYEESLKHATNINLAGITEWQPLVHLPLETVLALVVIAIVTAVLLLKRKTVSLPYVLAIAVVTYFAFSAIKFLTNFGIMATYFLGQHIGTIHWTKPVPRGIRLALTISFLCIIAIDAFVFKRYFLLVDPRIIRYSWSNYCQTIRDCSEEVTDVMLKDPPKGNGYHFYNYGGYLSWRVPMVKTFMDGRMAAWERDGKTPPHTLAYQVVSGGSPIPFITLDREYHFEWAIVQTEAPIVKYLDSLSQKGWQKRYADPYFSYFVKVRP